MDLFIFWYILDRGALGLGQEVSNPGERGDWLAIIHLVKSNIPKGFAWVKDYVCQEVSATAR